MTSGEKRWGGGKSAGHKRADFRRSGSVSVLLTCLLAGVVSVFSLLYNAASFRTLQSAVEWNAANAGRAVLTYYIPELFQEYGICAMWNETELIESRMEEFVRENSPFWRPASQTGLLRAEEGEATIKTEQHSLMSAEEMQKQIYRVMEYGAAFSMLQESEFISSMRELFALVQEGVWAQEQQEAEDMPARGDAVQFASVRSATAQNSESAEEEQRRLLRRLRREADKREEKGKKLLDEIPEEGGNALTDPQRIAALPSRKQEQRLPQRSWRQLCTGGMQSLQEVLSFAYADLYAVQHFGNYRDRRDSWFDCELEYILHGKLSDRENIRKTKTELFFLRTLLNLAAICKEGELRRTVSAMATAAAPIPYPVAFGLISSSLCAGEAGGDVKKLMEGSRLPVLKTAGNFRMLGGQDEERESAFTLSYETHLQLLLLLRGQETKIVRMMDLIQLNMSRHFGEEFILEDCCTGFDWQLTAVLKNSVGREKGWSCDGISHY